MFCRRSLSFLLMLTLAQQALSQQSAPLKSPTAGHSQTPAGQRPSGIPSRIYPASLSHPAAWVPAVNVYPPRFVRITFPTLPRLTGDYYQEILKTSKGKIIRFTSMPIPVYIAPYVEKQYTQACVKAFAGWEEQTQGAVRFVQVDDPYRARIKVEWSHLGINKAPGGCSIGAHTITKWKASASSNAGAGFLPGPLPIPQLGPKYSVPAQIIEVNLDLIASKKPELRYQVLQNVVTHELGHALGLLGHSPYRTDMMFAVTDEHSRLSPRDINTLQKLYRQKADIAL